MKKEIRKNKLIQILKLSSDSLLSAWSMSAPPRFSNDESGLKYWRNEASKNLLIEDEKELKEILDKKIDPSIAEKSDDWSFFSSFFPDGERIRRLWRNREDSSFSSFISWIKKSGITNSNLIIGELEKSKSDFSAKKEEIPAEIPAGMSVRDSSDIPVESSNTRNLSKKIEYNISAVSDEDFYKEILRGIEAPESRNNMLYLFAWRQAEGGNAAFNPFNTTQRADGATNYNKVGVKNYTSAEQGIKATIKTLLNGRYGDIISSLRRSADPMETADALERSPWGTGGLAKKVISGYQAGYSPKPKPIAKA